MMMIMFIIIINMLCCVCVSTGGRRPGNVAHQAKHEAHIECGISWRSGEEGRHGEATWIRRSL